MFSYGVLLYQVDRVRFLSVFQLVCTNKALILASVLTMLRGNIFCLNILKTKLNKAYFFSALHIWLRTSTSGQFNEQNNKCLLIYEYNNRPINCCYFVFMTSPLLGDNNIIQYIWSKIKKNVSYIWYIVIHLQGHKQWYSVDPRNSYNYFFWTKKYQFDWPVTY